MFRWLACWLLVAVAVAVRASPTPRAHREPEPRGLAERLASRSRPLEVHLGEQRLPLPTLSLLQEPPEQRLGLPSPQEIEAIKKVAQILVMLGEQVIPAIVGGAGQPARGSQPLEEDEPDEPVVQE